MNEGADKQAKPEQKNIQNRKGRKARFDRKRCDLV